MSDAAGGHSDDSADVFGHRGETSCAGCEATADKLERGNKREAGRERHGTATGDQRVTCANLKGAANRDTDHQPGIAERPCPRGARWPARSRLDARSRVQRRDRSSSLVQFEIERGPFQHPVSRDRGGCARRVTRRSSTSRCGMTPGGRRARRCARRSSRAALGSGSPGAARGGGCRSSQAPRSSREWARRRPTRGRPPVASRPGARPAPRENRDRAAGWAGRARGRYAAWMRPRNCARMMQPPFQMRASSARSRFHSRTREATRSRFMPWA